jgi:polyphosphate kinase 2 (PPK2 family)
VAVHQDRWEATTPACADDRLLDIDKDLSRYLDDLLLDETDDDDEPVLRWKDGRLVDTWRESYPYAERMPRAEYEVVKRQLQIELLKLQNWVKATDQRIVILFEGRDAAGKGGTIKRFTEHLNPRGGTSSAFPRQGRWSCSTAPGTTAPSWRR